MNEKHEIKVKHYIKVLLMVAICILGLSVTKPVQATSEIYCSLKKPKIATEKITDQTTKIKVKCAADTTLYVENEKKQIAKVYYEKAEYKDITIKKQKPATRIYFWVKNKQKERSDTVTKWVVKKKKTKIGDEKNIRASVKEPEIATKKLTNKTKEVKVKCKKGQTLYIRKGVELVKKVYYEKTQYKTIEINTWKKGYTLTFYTKNKKGKRSAGIQKKVKDVIAPKTPVFKIDGDVKVIGEKGIYVWIYEVDTFEEEEKFDPYIYPIEYYSGKTNPKGIYYYERLGWTAPSRYIIRLVDKAGNASKPVVYTIEPDGTETIKSY